MGLLPIGTVVSVQERGPDARTYTGRIAGYDIGHTKYHLGVRLSSGDFTDGITWAFPAWCQESAAIPRLVLEEIDPDGEPA